MIGIDFPHLDTWNLRGCNYFIAGLCLAELTTGSEKAKASGTLWGAEQARVSCIELICHHWRGMLLEKQLEHSHVDSEPLPEGWSCFIQLLGPGSPSRARSSSCMGLWPAAIGPWSSEPCVRFSSEPMIPLVSEPSTRCLVKTVFYKCNLPHHTGYLLTKGTFPTLLSLHC